MWGQGMGTGTGRWLLVVTVLFEKMLPFARVKLLGVKPSY